MSTTTNDLSMMETKPTNELLTDRFNTRTKNTSHLTLKMTFAKVVEMSVNNDCSFQIYSRPDDHTIRTADVLGLKTFTKK